MSANTAVRRKLNENLRRVHDQIASACARSGRDPKTVTLVAVTKIVEIDVIRALLELGQIDIGESRVQALTQRAGMIAEMRTRIRNGGAARTLPAPRWHMIGHLQRNKVKPVLQHTALIHSIDSLRLVEEISGQAAPRDQLVDVLLEVNASEEKVKQGLAVGAVVHMAEQVHSLPGLRLRGLMCMAPLTEDQGVIRHVFARTRELFEEIQTDNIGGPNFAELSMGMSNDYEIAVEEGATIIRVGTALFEGIAPAA